MELIRISPTKLKIMLTAQDVKKYALAVSDGCNITGSTALREILSDVKDKCGFDAVGSRVFVQYYESIEGGCEMFITKLSGDASPGGGEVKENGRAGRKRSGTERKHAERYDSGYIVYSFDSLCGVLLTCRCLAGSEYTGESSVYVIEDKCRYYLVLERETCFAAENNGLKCMPSYFYVICEHGRLVCTDAVEKLAPLA